MVGILKELQIAYKLVTPTWYFTLFETTPRLLTAAVDSNNLFANTSTAGTTQL